MSPIYQIVATDSKATMWPAQTIATIIDHLAAVENDLRDLDRIATTHKPRDDFTRAATGTAYVCANRLKSIQNRLATIIFPKPNDLPNPTATEDQLTTATKMLSKLATSTLNFHTGNYNDRQQLAVLATTWLISIGANHLNPPPPAEITDETNLNQ
jgi:hypothetical protein